MEIRILNLRFFGKIIGDARNAWVEILFLKLSKLLVQINLEVLRGEGI
jgi:hypothetical protein